MLILKKVDFSKLIYKKLTPEHILLIEYINQDGKKIRRSFKNNGSKIQIDGIKKIIKARVGRDKAWKDVLDIVEKKMLFVDNKCILNQLKNSQNKVLQQYFNKDLTPNTVTYSDTASVRESTLASAPSSPHVPARGTNPIIQKNIELPIIKNFNFNISNKILLFYFGFNLNLTGGNTVMATNYLNKLMENDNKIILLSPFPIKNIFLQNLRFNKYNIIDCSKENHKELFKKYENKCDLIFIRQLKNINSLKDETYLKKTIIYEVGAELDNIKELNNKFHSIITQSEKLKIAIENSGVNSTKIKIIEPFVYKYDFDLPKRNDNEIRLIYCGTIRDEENILEIIEEFEKIHKERPEVVLKIVYGKIYGDTNFTTKIRDIINKGVDGITFKHNLSHRDACYEIATSDIGICWRKNGWGDNGEISTKVKEYEMYGVCICNILKELHFCTDLKETPKITILILNTNSNILIQTILNLDYNKSFTIYDYKQYNKNVVYDFVINIGKIKPNFTNYRFLIRDIDSIEYLKYICKSYRLNYLFNNLRIMTKKDGGCVANELQQLHFLTYFFSVFYNSIYINDIINSEGTIDYKSFFQRENIIDLFMPKYKNSNFFKTNGLMNIYRCFTRKEFVDLFKKLNNPKIFGHQYIKNDPSIWNNYTIGPQNIIMEKLMLTNEIKNIANDGTLFYEECDIIPKTTFVRGTFINNTFIDTVTTEKINIKKELDTDFIICIIGTIYEYTEPISILKIIDNLRISLNKNIKLLILSSTIKKLIDKLMMKYSWIHNKYYENESDYITCLKQCDLVINTWKQDSCLYSSSNKVTNCIAYRVPILLPRTPSYENIIGSDYKFFFKYDIIDNDYSIESQIQIKDLITNFIQGKINYEYFLHYYQKQTVKFNTQNLKLWYTQLNTYPYNGKKILIIQNNVKLGGAQKYGLDIARCFKYSKIHFLFTDLKFVPENDFMYKYKYYNDLNSDEYYEMIIMNNYPMIQQDKLLEQCKLLRKMTSSLNVIVHTEYNNFAMSVPYIENYIDNIVVVSNFLRRKMIKSGVSDNKLKVIYPFTETSVLLKKNKCEHTRLVYYGRMIPNKGVKLLVQYWEKIYKQLPKCKLYLIGDSTESEKKYYDSIISYIKSDESLYNSIVIDRRNITSELDKQQIIKNTDIYISLGFTEGLPYTISEFIYHNIPCISIKHAGLAEIIVENINGLLLNFKGVYFENLNERKTYGNKLNENLYETYYDENFKEFNRIIEFINSFKFNTIYNNQIKPMFHLDEFIYKFCNINKATNKYVLHICKKNDYYFKDNLIHIYINMSDITPVNIHKLITNAKCIYIQEEYYENIKPFLNLNNIVSFYK